MIYEVSRRFGVQGVTRHRVVPHVTIVGSFQTTDERKVINAIERCGNNFDLVASRLTALEVLAIWKVLIEFWLLTLNHQRS